MRSGLVGALFIELQLSPLDSGGGLGSSSGGPCGDVQGLIFLLDYGLVEFGHAFDLPAPVLGLPLVIAFRQDGTCEAPACCPRRGAEGQRSQHADDVDAALDLLVQPPERIG